MNESYNRNEPAPQTADPFHGAAIVLEDGREIPITEHMVQDALSTLEHAGDAPEPPQTHN